jgi:ABC-type antimicrobial peptide transport system permease subunit
MALGARRGDVLRLVLQQVLRFAGAGIAAGTLLGLGLAQVIGSLLYGISAYDARVFLLTAVVLVLVALGAAYIPALRATKLDPLVALRYE